jgi:hypothetical protein
MPNNNAERAEREARREYVHYRHRLVIGFAITFLVAVVVLAALVLAGVVHTEDQEASRTTKANNYGVTAPCPPKDAAAPAYSQITVRVLNGTTSAGLANAVNQALQLRGFSTQDVANSTTKLDRTEIRAGKNAVTQAYVINQEFPDAILRLDDRTDMLVDVILGNSFDDLAPTSQVTKPGKKLVPLQGCMAVKKMKTTIKAPKHTAVAPPNTSAPTAAPETSDTTSSGSGE